MEPDTRSRTEILSATIQRLAAYTGGRLTLFSRGSSVAFGLASAIADAEYAAHRTYAALLRRFSALGATGLYLNEAMAEHGVERAPPTRARVLVIVRPAATTAANLRTSGGDDYLEVEDATHFAALSAVRIRSADGTVTEQAVVGSVSVGTGPVNGWDELVFTGGLSNSYNPTTESVAVVRRVVIPDGTRLNSSAGIQFDTLESIATSDRNPVLDGESTALALADKVWAEATVTGGQGNVGPRTISGFATPIDGILSAFNPGPATGGFDEEDDDTYRFRGVHVGQSAAQETRSWLEALCQQANPHVARALRTTTTEAGTMAIKVLPMHGGTFTAAELAAIKAYLESRVRGYMTVSVSAVTLTSVEIVARVTLDPDADLDAAWRAANERVAAFLDFRTWTEGDNPDEADLLAIVKGTQGIATLETATFQPSADVEVGAESFPVLVSIALTDTTTGLTRNADMAVGY